MAEVTHKRLAYKISELPDLTGLSLQFWYRAHSSGRLKTQRPPSESKKGEGPVLVMVEDLDSFLRGESADRKEQAA